MEYTAIKLFAPTVCPKCKKNIPVGTEVFWVREQQKKGMKTKPGLYHPECYKGKTEEQPFDQQIADTLLALEGRTIKTARYMTQQEMGNMAWGQAPIVLGLDDGTLLIPSRDPEGNEAGSLFTQDPEGNAGCLGSLPTRIARKINRRLP